MYICRIIVAALLGVLGKMAGLYVLGMGIIWFLGGFDNAKDISTIDSSFLA